MGQGARGGEGEESYDVSILISLTSKTKVQTHLCLSGKMISDFNESLGAYTDSSDVCRVKFKLLTCGIGWKLVPQSDWNYFFGSEDAQRRRHK